MKVGVVGLWHLGSVTAACLAQAGFDVLAFDPDHAVIDSLQQNRAPLFEPGLNDLILSGTQHNRLHFTHDRQALSDTDLIWITFDTPVDDHDVADVEKVITEVHGILPYLKNATTLLISSQLPVGTTRNLSHYAQNTYPNKNFSFAYSPENLRLGNAIHVFQHPERIVIGINSPQVKEKIMPLLERFSSNLLWMSWESAEMTKHALNAFLATSVVFINELATLCESVGADAREVEKGLKSEARIGKKAYLRPGPAIAGGTLARDVNFLTQIGTREALQTPLFSSILKSNAIHKQWACQRIQQVLGNLQDKKIAILGLAYKAGTDTLRRSASVETCLALQEKGAIIMAFDPAIHKLPPKLSPFITLQPSLKQAITHADALVITTEDPTFIDIASETITTLMKKPYVFDAGGILFSKLSQHKGVFYYTVGSEYNTIPQ